MRRLAHDLKLRMNILGGRPTHDDNNNSARRAARRLLGQARGGEECVGDGVGGVWPQAAVFGVGHAVADDLGAPQQRLVRVRVRANGRRALKRPSDAAALRLQYREHLHALSAADASAGELAGIRDVEDATFRERADDDSDNEFVVTDTSSGETLRQRIFSSMGLQAWTPTTTTPFVSSRHSQCPSRPTLCPSRRRRRPSTCPWTSRSSCPRS